LPEIAARSIIKMPDAIETLCRGSQRRGPVSPNSCRRCGASPAESDRSFDCREL